MIPGTSTVPAGPTAWFCWFDLDIQTKAPMGPSTLDIRVLLMKSANPNCVICIAKGFSNVRVRDIIKQNALCLGQILKLLLRMYDNIGNIGL